MEIFKTLQSAYQATGTYPQHLKQNYSLNLRNLYYLITLTMYLFSMSAFLMFEAATVMEFAESFFISWTTFVALATFLVHFWKTSDALGLIAKYEKFINKSKAREIFY